MFPVPCSPVTTDELTGFQVIDPPNGQPRVCHGNQSCTIAWVDDGEAPLLNLIGLCYVALYNGEQVRSSRVSWDQCSATDPDCSG